MPKRIFTFRKGEAERPADAIESLGLKGANLALLASLDLPVPPGFTISTAAWREAKASGESMPMALRSDLNAMVEWLERVTDRRFDGDRRPLLLAVRTSGPAAMPGLADSVLDIGLNDRTVEILARELSDPDFAFRNYRRLVESYAQIVHDADPTEFEELSDAEAAERGWSGEPSTIKDWRALMARYHAFLDSELGVVLPQTPFEQLVEVVSASFASWRSPAAAAHRVLHGIPENAGLAVTVHAMRQPTAFQATSPSLPAASRFSKPISAISWKSTSWSATASSSCFSRGSPGARSPKACVWPSNSSAKA